MDMKRRDLLGGGALAAAWALGGAGGALAQPAGAAPAAPTSNTDPEYNKRLLL
jgi:nitrous oxide reductase